MYDVFEAQDDFVPLKLNKIKFNNLNNNVGVVYKKERVVFQNNVIQQLQQQYPQPTQQKPQQNPQPKQPKPYPKPKTTQPKLQQQKLPKPSKLNIFYCENGRRINRETKDIIMEILIWFFLGLIIWSLVAGFTANSPYCETGKVAYGCTRCPAYGQCQDGEFLGCNSGYFEGKAINGIRCVN
ncbi:hypothetical protein DLAC_06921 [Tieghemostelium lacteum]|uniref:Transmembrane protein n=1 Tax=Tieghemostelium lacteum TaxID=361077 RepID=A0A151ZDW9_TIELA|nr:hypothetical protein DLAC_06921 [Tieghemostelium lacteum]|eukprot:KYQ92084.1 hypothetical protein DLAC_06921 [Tieghemostelium lacteum]